MAQPLRDLARFIAAKDTDDERAEIRAYALEHAAELAPAFGVTEEAYRAGISRETDDAKLARRLVVEVKSANVSRRDLRAVERTRLAQSAADALALTAKWDGLVVSFDLAAMWGALTSPGDVLVFDAADVFPSVVVPMRLLAAVARLRRRPGMWGFVDATGLHLRYPNACRGTSGFNFRSQHELLPQKGRYSSKPIPDQIVVHVAPSLTRSAEADASEQTRAA